MRGARLAEASAPAGEDLNPNVRASVRAPGQREGGLGRFLGVEGSGQQPPRLQDQGPGVRRWPRPILSRTDPDRRLPTASPKCST